MKKIFTVILALLLVLSVGGNVFLYLKYSDTGKEVKVVQKEKEELTSKLETVEKEKKTTADLLNSVTKDYEELVEEYNDLVERYNKECVPEVEQPQNLEEYATNISYDDLSRTPDKFEGKAVCYSGEVVQLLEGEEYNNLRVAIDGDYDKMIYLEYEPSIIPTRVLEDDTITFYGIYYGIYQYESTMGATISIPAVAVDYIEIK